MHEGARPPGVELWRPHSTLCAARALVISSMFHTAPLLTGESGRLGPRWLCAGAGSARAAQYTRDKRRKTDPAALVRAWFRRELGAMLQLASFPKVEIAPVSLDRELLGRARAGDGAAFEELIRPHVASVRRLTFAFAHSWADADDLAQEALMKAFRAIGSFQERSELGTWLYSVTRNVCRDFYRGGAARERSQEDSFDDEAPDVQPSSAPQPADELLESKNDAERLWKFLKELAPEFRVPLVLFEVEGLGYEEIAKIERVPIGTIRSRLARARQQLKSRMLALPRDTFPPIAEELPLRPSNPGSPA